MIGDDGGKCDCDSNGSYFMVIDGVSDCNGVTDKDLLVIVIVFGIILERRSGRGRC